jgi:predicted porin
MKKHLTVLAALCACVAPAAEAANVTLWGIAEISSRYTSGLDGKQAPVNGHVVNLLSGVRNMSRWGLHVREDLGSGYQALAEFESGFKLDAGNRATDAKQFDRASYLGLQGGFGRLTLGRQTNLLADALIRVDPLGVRFAGFNPGVQYAALSAHGLGRDYGNGGSSTGSYRLDNSIKYTGGFGNWTAQVMNSFGEIGNDASALSSEGAGLAFKSGRLTLTGAVSRLRDAGSERLDAGIVGAAFRAADWRVSGYLSRSTAQMPAAAQTRQTLATLGFSKKLLPQLELIAAVSHLSRERTASADDGFTRVISFLEYSLSKRTVVFLEGDATAWHGAFRGKGDAHGRGVSLGIAHRF